MSGVEVDGSLAVTAKHDVSNDIGKINKGEDGAQIMDVETIGNGQPEQNSSSFAVLKKKSVADASGEKSQSDVNAAKAEGPVREKHDTNGSSSPVKRKQVSEKSDSESEDHASPTKKPRSEAAKHTSDEEHADSPTKMSDEGLDSSVHTSTKKEKRPKLKAYEDVDEDELGPALLEQPVVLVEGQKREKKKVQRFELTPQEVKKRKQPSIEEGSGTKLGDIPNVNCQLNKTMTEDLKPLYRLLFDTVPPTNAVTKKNIRQFSGFTFSADSNEKKKKVDKLTKLPLPLVKSFCVTLDLERGGKKEDVMERIISFLMEPKSSNKPLPSSAKKRRRSSKSKTSHDSEGSAKKTKVKKAKKEEKESGDKSNAEDETSEPAAEDIDKSASSPAKSPKPPKKKKKPSTPAKTTPKVQKKTPKSSSAKKVKKPSKKSKASSSESSGDESDEPLGKKKVPPTDDMLKSVVKKILKTADLEEVTMKTVCKQVYDKFPEFDLTSRKDFIKATVKQILK